MSTPDFPDIRFCLKCQDGPPAIGGWCRYCYGLRAADFHHAANQAGAVGALAKANELRLRAFRMERRLLAHQTLQGATA